MFDGKVEKSVAAGAAGGDASSENVKLFRAVLPAIDTTGLMRTPCGVCPVSMINDLIMPKCALWFFFLFYGALRYLIHIYIFYRFLTIVMKAGKFLRPPAFI